MTVAEVWERGQRGWPRAFPVVQFPNSPLLIAFAGWGVARVADGTAHDAGRAVFAVGVGVWGWQEATAGANWLRRVFGVAGLVWIVAKLAGEI